MQQAASLRTAPVSRNVSNRRNIMSDELFKLALQGSLAKVVHVKFTLWYVDHAKPVTGTASSPSKVPYDEKNAVYSKLKEIYHQAEAGRIEAALFSITHADGSKTTCKVHIDDKPDPIDQEWHEFALSIIRQIDAAKAAGIPYPLWNRGGLNG